MKAITSILQMHLRKRYYWFFPPSFVLFTSFIINLGIAYFLSGTTALYTGGVASIYLYLFTIGVIAVNDTFPFVLGLSQRRIDYLLGTVAMAAVTTLGWA